MKKKFISIKNHNGIEIRMGTFVIKWMNYNLEREDLATVGIQSGKGENRKKEIFVDR